MPSWTFSDCFKNVGKNVIDLASAFLVTLFEKILSAVNTITEFDEETQTYKKPYNASAIGTSLRKNR